MILIFLIAIPVAAGLLGWWADRWGSAWPRRIALAGAAAQLALACTLFGAGGGGPWLSEVRAPWVPQLGTSFHLAADGLSLLLVVLTAFLGILSVACSWSEVQERVGFFHLNLMLTLAGVTGVFLALDLFLFYFFWELMLVPMYFLIDIWGHERRHYAAVKFFIFTQMGGLLMLLAILGLYFVHGRSTGAYTFDYTALLGTTMSPAAAMWLMLGFFVAFAVKLPAVPFHTWLPDAHTQAPTAGSVVLAGLLLKTGAYGLLRFAVPLFPAASRRFTTFAMVLAVVGILYGAYMAFAQTDLKRLVAYTSISHLGFVLLGIYAWNALALQGAVMQMIAHGVSTGALFVLAGILQERLRTREMDDMGGFWTAAPRMGGMMMFFAMASLGLPGMGNFIGEFLVLQGAYAVTVTFTAIAAAGLIAATIYAVWMVQRPFHGTRMDAPAPADIGARETATLGVMAAVILFLGLFPQATLNTASPALRHMEQQRPLPEQQAPQAIWARLTDQEARP
jgi:NADH-quinone oxidoreductase subunit M